MKVLLIGHGGREAALAYALQGSKHCTHLEQRDAFDPNDPYLNEADLVICGPEQPLCDGLYDQLDDRVPHVLGPSKAGAQLEASKDFAKAFMQRHNIPTAAYKTFNDTTLDDGIDFLQSLTPPYVLKADGLAAGKGVIITPSLAEAEETLRNMLGGQFGEASKRVLIEQFLDGIELSVFILTDGRHYVTLPPAKDYKRALDGDEGPNTGGMGATTYLPFATYEFMQKVDRQIIQPTVNGLAEEGIDYKGFIFFGLICVKGEPYLIEYNCRLGDPETQAVLPVVDEDLLPLIVDATTGNLKTRLVTRKPHVAMCVNLVSKGYPGPYKTGYKIEGLQDLLYDTYQFKAAVKEEGGHIMTNGGRVISIVRTALDPKQAREKVYYEIGKIACEGLRYRTDIGLDVLNWKKE